MRIANLIMTAAFVGLLALPVAAQEPDGGGPPPADPELKQRILTAFDTNGDGELDRAERQAIRRGMQAFFTPAGPEGRGPAGRDPEGRRGPRGQRGPGARPGPDAIAGPDAAQGPDGPDDRPPRDRDAARRPRDGRGGPGGPDGQAGPPNPMRLFNRFDEDQDNELSRREYVRLTRFVRERFHPGPPPGGPDGPRFDRGRGDGPPPMDGPRGEFRRRGWRDDRPPRADGPPPAEEPIPELAPAQEPA